MRLYECEHAMDEEAPGPCKWCWGNYKNTAIELQSRIAKLEAALEKAEEDFRWIKIYSESEYKQGDKGYQFAIYAKETLSEIRAIRGDG